MGTHPIFESDFDCLTDIMSTHDSQEEELKKQIEKIAESVKEKAAEASEAAADESTDDQNATQATISQHIRDFQQKLKLEGQMSKKDWAFWDTHPVPKLDEDITDQNMGPIEPSRD